MLKFLIFMLFLMFLCLMNYIYWLVQMYLLLLSLIFMILINNNSMFMNMSLFMGMDLISYGLILLSMWICFLMLMASESINRFKYNKNFFLLNVMCLLIMLYLTFSSMNLFYFYLFFEMSLIPVLFLIIGWGYQPERIQAGIYLMFYTLLASLPMLVGIFFLYKDNSLIYYFLDKKFNNYLFYMIMIFAFLVKMPMFLVHLWLPKAHVEAPISGSMILAGIMLKLGGYGIMRVMNLILLMSMKFNYFWMVISLMGGLLISLICLRQTDLKSLIAYSSVSHMSIVIGGIMTLSFWGFIGSYLMMIAHGLCSSGLFCLANMIYERTSSRSLLINKGLMNFMPSMCLWWFLLSTSNMAAPPSLNLLGEILLLSSIISWSWISMFLLSLMSFFSAVYTLYLYSYSQHGNLYSSMFSSSNGSLREYLLLMLHWIPLNLLIMKSEICSLWL
uniref:NADH-ubiquinone oxidoreductase chain 4 n=2 Tax=Rapisma TaxID=560872 RepID=V9PP92_9NEOP|nr:NADH dehydrogenase subunit 4 [Rapisma xizangense]YP_009000269.1 NADH dehydrogenase subunit 4 [Rapisma zayuanum]AHA35662.1 NADH dehydrogenase subunit 4 [Rapisma xizangense]AHA35675.1 NADH dehydrogenase subunit 4 [Rapisma zayuanum]